MGAVRGSSRRSSPRSPSRRESTCARPRRGRGAWRERPPPAARSRCVGYVGMPRGQLDSRHPHSWRWRWIVVQLLRVGIPASVSISANIPGSSIAPSCPAWPTATTRAPSRRTSLATARPVHEPDLARLLDQDHACGRSSLRSPSLARLITCSIVSAGPDLVAEPLRRGPVDGAGDHLPAVGRWARPRPEAPAPCRCPRARSAWPSRPLRSTPRSRPAAARRATCPRRGSDPPPSRPEQGVLGHARAAGPRGRRRDAHDLLLERANLARSDPHSALVLFALGLVCRRAQSARPPAGASTAQVARLLQRQAPRRHLVRDRARLPRVDVRPAVADARGSPRVPRPSSSIERLARGSRANASMLRLRTRTPPLAPSTPAMICAAVTSVLRPTALHRDGPERGTAELPARLRLDLGGHPHDLARSRRHPLDQPLRDTDDLEVPTVASGAPSRSNPIPRSPSARPARKPAPPASAASSWNSAAVSGVRNRSPSTTTPTRRPCTCSCGAGTASPRAASRSPATRPRPRSRSPRCPCPGSPAWCAPCA